MRVCAAASHAATRNKNHTWLCTILCFICDFWRLSFLTPEVKTQRRVWQVRVIILRPWTNQPALVVVVVLIPDVPIQSPVQSDREPALRRLKTHRIRRD